MFIYGKTIAINKNTLKNHTRNNGWFGLMYIYVRYFYVKKQLICTICINEVI